MAQAARSYYTYGSTAPRRAPEQQTRPNVRVLPGHNTDAQTLSSTFVAGTKLAFALIIFVALLAGARVWISTQTVQMLQTNETMQAQLDDAYAAGHELEINHSVLASTTRIQSEASRLGMSAPEETVRITVDLPAKEQASAAAVGADAATINTAVETGTSEVD